MGESEKHNAKRKKPDIKVQIFIILFIQHVQNRQI